MHRTPLALAILLNAPQAVLAQALAPAPGPAAIAATPPAKAEPAKIQRVEINGAADYDPRRDDTASKTVLHAAEITKFGDTNVFDVLKRAPGVTVIGNSIRMRGLGNGYTQILVNGDRAPPGFSLDTLAPDQIERIEIMRAPTAAYSMQAIAGTINIVLRSVVAKPQRDLQLRVGHDGENDFRMANGQVANKAGRLSYFVGASLFANDGDKTNSGAEQFFLPDGSLAKSRTTSSHHLSDIDALGLFTRLNWKLANGDDLNAQLRGQFGRTRFDSNAQTDVALGRFSQPEYLENYTDNRGRRRSLYGEINWIAKLAGGKLDLKLNADRSRSSNDIASQLYTAGRAASLARQWDSTTHGTQHAINLKFNRALFDGHALSTGVEISRLRSEEERDRIERPHDAIARHVLETFAPTVTRLAGYAQDEWNVTKNWSMYLGARWEQLRTVSATASSQSEAQSSSMTTRSRNQVLSPVAQTLYKFPDKSGRQLRLALSRTFKAPTTEQLTARRYEAPVNDRFSPDSGGNPDLQPELAKGIDLTYEHLWAPGAVFSVSASARQIDDYIRTRLQQDADGRWVFMPSNDGQASVRSLELELKFPLRSVAKSAPPLDLRLNLGRYWSHVDTVPGPDNRLDAQVPLSANFGVDYRKDALSTGASISYRRGGPVRISLEESQRLQSRREIEAYLLWKFNPRYQARVSLANLAGRDIRTYREYRDASGRALDTSINPSTVRVTVSLEAKF